MMTEKEGWEIHGLEAIGQVVKRGILWKLFNEAIRVMKLSYHEHITEYFQGLTKNHETTLELLMRLKFASGLSEYQAILSYLSYWGEEH